MKPTAQTNVEKMGYEEAYAELEEIIAALETGEQPLDKAMELFERGQALSLRCAKLLDDAELKVRQLTGQNDPLEEG